MWLFDVVLWVMASSLLSSLSAHVLYQHGLRDSFHWIMTPASASIFTRHFAFILRLIFTFCTKAGLSLRHRTHLLEQYGDWTFAWCWYLCIIVWTDERGTFRHLEIVPMLYGRAYGAITRASKGYRGTHTASAFSRHFFELINTKAKVCIVD